LCGGESFGKGSCACKRLFGQVAVLFLMYDFFRWCFRQVVLHAVTFWLSRFARNSGEVFRFMCFVLGKYFGFLVVVLCLQVFVMVFLYSVYVLPE